MGRQPEVLLTLYKSNPHCCEITLENGKTCITHRIKMPLSSYLTRQFWFWLTIWNFCGLGMHTAASCLWLCNPPSPHTWDKCEKNPSKCTEQSSKVTITPTSIFPKSYLSFSHCWFFHTPGLQQVSQFLPDKKILNTSKRQDHMPLTKKERSRK